jgi:hypothetical protein
VEGGGDSDDGPGHHRNVPRACSDGLKYPLTGQVVGFDRCLCEFGLCQPEFW